MRPEAAGRTNPLLAFGVQAEFREILCTSTGQMHRRRKGREVTPRGIHHIDLAVTDVDASLAFYLDLLGPLGLAEEVRYPTYRGSEDVVHLVDAHDRRGIGLRPADGGDHSYYDVGIEHLAFEVENRDDVDAAHERCLARGARIHFPPEEDRDEVGYYAFFVFDPDGMRIEVFCWPRDDA